MLFRFEPCRTCPPSAHLDLDGSLAPHDPDRPAGVVRGKSLEEGRALPPVAGERRAPGEVSQLDLPLSGYKTSALRQLYPDVDGPGELLVGGYAGYVRRQVTDVLDGQLDTTEALGELLRLQAGSQARGRGCMAEGETGQLLALRSEEFRRRILGCELGLPAPPTPRVRGEGGRRASRRRSHHLRAPCRSTRASSATPLRAGRGRTR